MFIELCHKCYGLVHADRQTELNSCQCISTGGNVHPASLEAAATMQAKREIEWLAMFVSQERGPNDREYQIALNRLCHAMKLSSHFGHGTVDWHAVANTPE